METIVSYSDVDIYLIFLNYILIAYFFLLLRFTQFNLSYSAFSVVTLPSNIRNVFFLSAVILFRDSWIVKEINGFKLKRYSVTSLFY